LAKSCFSKRNIFFQTQVPVLCENSVGENDNTGLSCALSVISKC